MSRILKKKSGADAFVQILITTPAILMLCIGVGAAFIFLGQCGLSYLLKARKEIIYIIVGALIPVYPFFVFISYYQSLAPLDCGHFGWWSDCGLFAGTWLVAEAIGIILIIKGLLLYGKKTDEEKYPQKSEKSKLKKRSTRSNPLM